MCAAVAALAFGSPAFAQDMGTAEQEIDWGEPAPREFGFEIGLTGGYQLMAADAMADPAVAGQSEVLAGGRLTINFNRWVAVEGGADLSVLGNQMQAATGSSSVEARAVGLLNLLPPWRLRPFIFAGYGARFALGNDPAAEKKDLDSRLVAGGGLKLRITDRIGVRADALAYVPFATAKSFIGSAQENNNNEEMDYAVIGSLYFSIGEIKPERRLLRERVMVRPSGQDTDKDGLPDTDDGCPNDAEDVDGFEDQDGCPDEDNDGDGLADVDDRCPTQAETRNGVEDNDGCPESDSDGDGFIGEADDCPEAPETPNNFEDNDGCPDEVPDEVKQFTGVIEGVNFKTGSGGLLRGSYSVLDRAVRVLNQYPSLRLEIRGHTDSRGRARKNLRLSEDRADAVRRYLISQGIAADRLEAVGVGEEEPIADNSTRSGRARNRRTEFRLIESKIDIERTQDTRDDSMRDDSMRDDSMRDDSMRDDSMRDDTRSPRIDSRFDP